MVLKRHIAVIGAGLTGQGIALLFAIKGQEVILFDPDQNLLTGAFAKIENNIQSLLVNGICGDEDVDSISERIKLGKNLKGTVTGSRLVVETLAEDIVLKRSFFREVEQYCSQVTIVATTSLAFDIDDIAGYSKIKDRILGIYFWSPPYLIPFVEVASGPGTIKDVMDYTCDLLEVMGQYPVVVKKDEHMLARNRMQQDLWGKFLSIAEPEDDT